MKKILITGSAGFIGFHLSALLLQHGDIVLGVDALTDYYDPDLKKQRNLMLGQHENYDFQKIDITNKKKLAKAATKFKPDIIIHLAAQAGVRYSIEAPSEYIDTNIIGTFNLIEIARDLCVSHLLMASTSSVYGASDQMPFHESTACDTPMSIYAATKLSTEMLAHSYSHLFKLPITMFRFFTVYGPWGRPDMALFKFAQAIQKGEEIEVYGEGRMTRDFTYVEDLVEAISRLIDCIPQSTISDVVKDSKSPIAPYRRINIGNSASVQLMDYIGALEDHIGKKAKKKFLPMQQGDVRDTLADTSLLKNLTGFSPATKYHDGIGQFVRWYLEHKAR